MGTLDKLVEAILEDPGYACGERSFAERIDIDDAIVVLDDFYAAHDEADQQLPEVAKKMRRTIACQSGCNGCCESLFLVSTTEAHAVARELSKPERENDRAEFELAAAVWLSRAGDRADEAAASFAEERTTRYISLVRAHGLDHIMCPLNRDGACTVYEVRPLPCRQGWVLDTSDYCTPSDDPNQPDAQLVTHKAYEDLVATGRQLSAGLQNALGDGVKRKPLVRAVLDALESMQRT